MAVCQYHQDRAGIGVCVRCRAVICAACCTRVDGRNHCHECLRHFRKKAERQAERRPTSQRGLSIAAGVVGLFFAWLAFLGLFWEIQGRLAP
jgi:hypothetical protein